MASLPEAPTGTASRARRWRALDSVGAFLARLRGVPPGEPAPLTPADFAAREPGRGRDAPVPWAIPALGWKDILWRTWREIGRDRLPVLAGGVTFFVLLATFPALAAFVSVYGLFLNVDQVESQIEQLAAVFPRDAVSLIGQEMLRLAQQRQETLSAAFAVSTLISVWSANTGMKALFDGLNVAYDESEKRPYLQRALITYAGTLSLVLFLAAVSALTIAAPMALHALGVHHLRLWWGPFRWLIVYLMAALAFTLIYRHGPSRAPARWRWVACGGFGAALLWMLGSLGFSWYVNNFTHFGATYGSLGAMIGFMLWIWVSVMIVLIGAEFNAEIEHQTACDSTTGPPEPIGARGAVMADNVGKAFTVSPREARHYVRDFLGRQVDHVRGALRPSRGQR